jgi:hypothetical protein
MTGKTSADLRNAEAIAALRFQKVREMVDTVIPPLQMPDVDSQNIRDNGRKVLAMHIMAIHDVGLTVTIPQSMGQIKPQPVQKDLLVDGYWWAQEQIANGNKSNPDAKDDFRLGEPTLVFVDGDEVTTVGRVFAYRVYTTSEWWFIAPVACPHRF